MTEILGVAEAVLYVDSMAEARVFYHEVLGLPVTAEFGDATFLQTGEHSTLILFTREALKNRTSIIPAHGSEGIGHVAFTIDPKQMDAWRERLITHQVEIEHEQDWPTGSHSIYFRDPAGHSIELIDGRHYPTIYAQVQEKTGSSKTNP